MSQYCDVTHFTPFKHDHSPLAKYLQLIYDIDKLAFSTYLTNSLL